MFGVDETPRQLPDMYGVMGTWDVPPTLTGQLSQSGVCVGFSSRRVQGARRKCAFDLCERLVFPSLWRKILVCGNPGYQFVSIVRRSRFILLNRPTSQPPHQGISLARHSPSDSTEWPAAISPAGYSQCHRLALAFGLGFRH